MKTVIAFIFTLGALAVYTLSTEDSLDDHQVAISHYCEMVQLWKDTDGQYGWPAYNGEGTCK